MSVWIVSKTDIDALVTIALRWTERGDTYRMTEPARSALTVTPDDAWTTGARLWMANHDAFNYGGPPENLDPDELAEAEADREEMPPYEFEAMPGMPAPETAVRMARYYRYQTAGDYWEESVTLPFEAVFATAMEWHGLVLLGRADASEMPEPFADELNVDLEASDIYQRSGWGLGAADRDLFVRLQ